MENETTTELIENLNEFLATPLWDECDMFDLWVEIESTINNKSELKEFYDNYGDLVVGFYEGKNEFNLIVEDVII